MIFKIKFKGEKQTYCSNNYKLDKFLVTGKTKIIFFINSIILKIQIFVINLILDDYCFILLNPLISEKIHQLEMDKITWDNTEPNMSVTKLDIQDIRDNIEKDLAYLITLKNNYFSGRRNKWIS